MSKELARALVCGWARDDAEKGIRWTQAEIEAETRRLEAK